MGLRQGKPHAMAKVTVIAALWVIGSAASASTASAQPRPTAPADFVAAAAGADQYEIMAGHVALIESHDPAIRAFAAQMVHDHTAAFYALRQAAVRSGLKPPSTSVGGDQAMLLAALQGVRGADFDRTYARQQVLAHVQALATEGSYARQGSDSDLRQAAQSDVPMIERHLQAAKALQNPNGS